MTIKIPNSRLATDDVLVALLLPISRLMLASGVGIDQLVSVAKQAYVEAAMSELFPAGSRVNISRLSVTTGLTRKEVSLLVDRITGGKDHLIHKAKEQRAIRVLRGWGIDPRFRDERGQPAKLPLRGSKKTFTLLVKLYGGDVTPISVLRELERMNAVAITQDGLLRIRASGRQFSLRAPQHMVEIASLLADFAGAITPYNPDGRSPTYFGFRDCDNASVDDAALFERTFSKRAAALLDGFDQWRDSRNGTRARSASKKKSRIGVGVYLIKSGASPRCTTVPSLKRLGKRRHPR